MRQLFLQVVDAALVLLYHSPECLLDPLAHLDDVFLNDSIFNAPVYLEFLQGRILFVYSMKLPVLDFQEGLLPLVVRVLARLDLSLLHVYDLPQVEDVLDSGLDIPDHFLASLNLLVGDLSLLGTCACSETRLLCKVVDS